jgi:hypothetical protein
MKRQNYDPPCGGTAPRWGNHTLLSAPLQNPAALSPAQFSAH